MPKVVTEQKRRTQLVETAARIFSEKGFETATMQDLAEAVGILKSSLYHYVSSKDDLLEEIVETAHREAWPLTVAADGADDPAREFVSSFLRWAAGNPHAATLLLEEQATLSLDTQARLATIRAAYRRYLAGAVGNAQRDVDPQLAAEALVGFLAAACRSTALSSRKADGLGAFVSAGLAA